MAISEESFVASAHRLARNPLGIIALFIVLVYAMAAGVTWAAGGLSTNERLPLIYFLVLFPVIVLAVFGWLVSKHPTSLYAPSDFRDDASYIAAAELRGAKAAAALTVAAISSDGAISHSQAANMAVTAVREASELKASKSTRPRRCVLWVDDRPENNSTLRDAFLEFGIDVSIALSTNQALDALESQSFAAIISDMGRKEGLAEGYVLLDAVRGRDIGTPFFIYAGSNSVEHRQEARRRGAQGSTNSANELFRDVTKAILNTSG